jgi:hypothetical protein
MRYTRQSLLILSFFSFCFLSFSQNQINPGNQIRWPVPSCLSPTAAYVPGANNCQNIGSLPSSAIVWPIPSCQQPMGVYNPATNSCLRFDQIPPGNVTWPAGCTPGMVYSPATNLCVPQGGSANNPVGQLYDFQLNGGSNFGVSSPNRIYTDVAGDIIGQAGWMTPLPKVNVQNPMFAGGADPQGVRPSAAAINAAIAYSIANPQAHGNAAIWVPAGTYYLEAPLRMNCNLHLIGDGEGASLLYVGTTAGVNYDGVVVSGGVGPQPNQWSCQGSIENITIHAPGGHFSTGTLLELINAVGFTVFKVRGSNGNRGLATAGSTERLRVIATEWDTNKWSVVGVGNENRFLDTSIASPGQDASNYCYSTRNCVNGVYPNNGWVTPQTVAAMTANGTTLTLVINGGTNGPSNNGISPLVAGHTFQLGGATNNPALNGFYTVASVQNTTPTGTQYTVTAATTITDTETPGSLTYSPTLLPEYWGAGLTVGGDTFQVQGGSIKSLWYSPCIYITNHQGGLIEDMYCEGFPFNNRVPVNPALMDVGYPWWTTTTGPITGTGATATAPVASTAYAFPYINDPADIPSNTQGGFYYIEPADYLVNSGAPSTAVSGITRGSYELALVVFSGTTQQVMFRARNQAGSTVTNVAWPAGSILAMQPQGSYGPVTIKSWHPSSLGPPGPGWASECVDGTNLTCATFLAGPIPNGYSTWTRAQKGSGGSIAMFEGMQYWGPNTAEIYGQDYIKVFGSSSIGVANPGSTSAAETTSVFNGQILNTGSPHIYAVQYPLDGSYAQVTYSDPSNDTTMPSNTNNYWSLYSNTSADPLTGDLFGHQYLSQHCFYDMAAGHALTRVCFRGSPANTGATAGFSFESWNATLSQWQVSFRTSGNNSTQFLAYNTGTGGQAARMGNTNATAATAASTFNGPPGWYDYFMWWNGTVSNNTGCGWTTSSNTAAGVTPTKINETYQCNGGTPLSLPVHTAYTVPAGSDIDLSGFTGGFKPPNQGRTTLTSGLATISTAAASSSAVYTLTNCGAAGTPGILSVGTITAGVSFNIVSSNTGDTSTVCWWVH